MRSGIIDKLHANIDESYAGYGSKNTWHISRLGAVN